MQRDYRFPFQSNKLETNNDYLHLNFMTDDLIKHDCIENKLQLTYILCVNCVPIIGYRFNDYEMIVLILFRSQYCVLLFYYLYTYVTFNDHQR